ncbi:MAG: alanine--tRNA ligase [Methylotenera sp.]|nr:alanine--tRNA ligase [Oligoflexia bacterium]
MKTAEIRSRFLKFFEKNGHTIVESSSIVPQNDPTLLFTAAGMVQFKDVFLGKDPRPYTRATTAQKCVRAGGKHNDLENVGFTARHHTFFEMLGNFSFGDYFKKEAIKFAWEFVTEELKMPKERLYVTVFETDDEAADIWHKQEGVPLDRIYRFGEKDNFWSAGDVGPCGPCTELFIDRGETYSCGKPTCAMGCDCDRYMEFWNLVFMQYDRDASGKLNPLPRPSVDTGAGLERIAAILQDVQTNYDTDAFSEIIQKTAQLAGKPYDPSNDPDGLVVSFRVVADHSRAATFLIGDGVMPSNEGRGYVLRRILRRAIRHGKKLGFTGPFMHKTSGFVIDQMSATYPDLKDKRAFIEKAIQAEEEQFFRTLEKGLGLLDDETAKLSKSNSILPGEIAFKLYDTYGFPLDLTRVICAERGFSIDEVGFEKAMDHQRAESRKHWKGSGQEALDSTYLEIAAALKAKGKLPKFTGYDGMQSQAECLALLVPDEKGLKKVDFITAPSLAATADSSDKGMIIEAVFAETPFYGESGGQTGDRGRVLGLPGDDFEGEVIDVQKPVADLYVAHIRPIKGSMRLGKSYHQETDKQIRALTASNHTATHLLHWALHELLGNHVKQAGSLVTPDLLRFDFTHFQPMTEAEVTRIEDMINEKIWKAQVVNKKEMKKDEAIAAGAIAFFGEKYGERVRVVKVGDFSTELCGGTHVDNSSDIHLFKIASETGIAAGVRRIIAYTSEGAYQYLRSRDVELKKVRDKIKATSVDEIIGRLEKMAAYEVELKRQLSTFQAKAAGGEVDEMISHARTTSSGAKLITALCEADAQGVKRLRDLFDRVKQKAPNSIVVLGMKDPESGKANLLVGVGPEALKSANANDILKQLSPLIEGKGGGKPDMAQAGGTKADGLPQALEAALKLFS